MTDLEDGYIKLFRSSLNNPLYKIPFIWHLWEYLLLKANHEPKKIIWNQKEMEIDRGSLITGRKIISLETGISERTVRTGLSTLVQLGMIEKSTSKSTSKFSYLSICNYDKFQSWNRVNDHQIDQQVTSNRPAGDQQVTTNKNVKNDKNVKNIKLSDEDFLKSLKENFIWIDFESTMIKIDAWLLAHPERKKTRRFIVNWLNKIEKPIGIKNHVGKDLYFKNSADNYECKLCHKTYMKFENLEEHFKDCHEPSP